ASSWPFAIPPSLSVWGSCPAPPETAEGIMDGLRGREKRKIQPLGGPHEGVTTPWGYTPGGCRPVSAAGEGRHHVAREPAELLLELRGRQPFGPVDHELIEAGIASLDLVDRLHHVRRPADEPRPLLDAVAQRGD